METKLLLYCLILTPSVFAQWDELIGLNNFMILKNDNFSTWIETNNLDPFPSSAGEVQFKAQNSVADLNCRIKNVEVSGHSRDIVTKNFTRDLILQTYTVDLELTQNITFYGEHETRGTVNSLYPISGHGTWYISVPTVNLYRFQIALHINVIENFIKIRSYSLDEIALEKVNGDRIHFERLLDNAAAVGYEEEIEEALFYGFSDYIIASNNDPLRQLFTIYWNETFQDVKFDEMAGITLPPSTTEDGPIG